MKTEKVLTRNLWPSVSVMLHIILTEYLGTIEMYYNLCQRPQILINHGGFYLLSVILSCNFKETKNW